MTVDSGQRTAVRKKLFAKEGFTLIELMIAASLISLIGLAILVTFASGFRVYERVQSYGTTQADVFFALEEMEKNLRSAFFYSVIGFEGDSKKVKFPAIVEVLETVAEEQFVVPSIGRVAYYLDNSGEDTKALKSERQNYAQAVGQAATGAKGQTLIPAKDIKFSYYSFNEATKESIWKDSWSKEDENLPKGVKIELTFYDGSRDVQLVRTVWIPTVREIKEEEQGEGEGGENEQ